MIWLLLASEALAQARIITPEHRGNCQAPSWSHDGSRLSYEVNDHEQRTVSLYVYMPGQEPERIAPPHSARTITQGFSTSGADQVVHELVWSPPALGTFLFTATSADQDYDIFLHGGGSMVSSPGADGGPAWSLDGRYIVFTSARTGQGDLYLIDTADVTAPPRQLTDMAGSAEMYATFSPDSQALAYVAHTDAGDQIFLIDTLDTPSGPQPTTLVSLGRTQTRPRFSPDGRHLAFYSDHTEPGRFDLYALKLSDRSILPIDEGVVLNRSGPTWTPDGLHLIYVRDDDNQLDPVYSAPVDGGAAPRKVHTETVGNRDLDVTQGDDGQLWLAVAAQGGSQQAGRDFHRIYVTPLKAMPGTDAPQDGP
jgi:Tol biopolymer transport system component